VATHAYTVTIAIPEWLVEKIFLPANRQLRQIAQLLLKRLDGPMVIYRDLLMGFHLIAKSRFSI
jgi:hypothetical protein